MNSRLRSLPLLVLSLAGLTAGLTADARAANDAERRAMLDEVKVSTAAALRRASTEVPGGLPMRIALVRRGEAVMHDVRLLVGDGEMRVEIDAVSGEVRSKRESSLADERRRELAALAPLLRTAEVAPAKAGELAMAKVAGGRVLVIETDVEDDALQFEVTLLGPQGLMKAEVDANTGEIASLAGRDAQPIVDPRLQTFDHTATGSLPDGWVSDAPGVDAPPTWTVKDDPTAPSPTKVLGLSGPAHDASAVLATWSQAMRAQDVDLEVKVRLGGPAGTVRGGGGVMWRLRDALEHYAVALDSSPRQLRLEVVRDGQRRRIAAVPVTIEPNRWYRLGVRHDGDRIQILLDGEARLEANDSTLPGEGAVGVWTRGDGLATFDDLKVEPKRPAGGG